MVPIRVRAVSRHHRQRAAVGDEAEHRAAGLAFDLADALPGHAELLPDLVERHRLVGEQAVGQNAQRPGVQHPQGVVEQSGDVHLELARDKDVVGA